MVAADRGGVFRILENAGNFTPEEVGTALELIDEWLDLGEHSGYLTYVLESEVGESKEVLGYVTFGPTPNSAPPRVRIPTSQLRLGIATP